MSKVQFNLLPDVKLDYIRSQNTKRLVYLFAFLVSGVAVGLVVLMFLSVGVVQKKQLRDADKDIKKFSDQLKAVDDLDKILTVQSQLNALPGLHDKKHVTSRLFDYLPKMTPPKLNVGKLTLDTEAKTLVMTGTADNLQTVNTFVDTLKFTSYEVIGEVSGGGQGQNLKKAFTSVVLDKFGRDERETSYSVVVSFEPDLFDVTKRVNLIVPSQYTTRSVTEGPGSVIFDGRTGNPKPVTEDNNPQNAEPQGGQ